uniref:Uncharacterized protein LOC100175235 n=1 Tax=Phallusia mammillata TaxID=59560 RepID=A0A6F9DGV7_9ASCI|nr:uncharacterized protein LOC100175235 [Phallusia mammillata]
MEHMKMVHVSDLCEEIPSGQMVMVVGWFENYTPYGGAALLVSPEKECSKSIDIELAACDVSHYVPHCLCRLVGRYYHENGKNHIKVMSINFIPNWQYENISKIIEIRKEGNFHEDF